MNWGQFLLLALLAIAFFLFIEATLFFFAKAMGKGWRKGVLQAEQEERDREMWAR